jgi:hypothetical protein
VGTVLQDSFVRIEVITSALGLVKQSSVVWFAATQLVVIDFNTPAPARVVCNPKHGGGSLTARNAPRLLGINGGIAFFLLPWSDTNFTHRGCG